jgi:hypothetical protein
MAGEELDLVGMQKLARTAFHSIRTAAVTIRFAPYPNG